MRSTDKYIVRGPSETVSRMTPHLLKEFDPKYHYSYTGADGKVQIDVAVYEEYQKQINSSVTLTLVSECQGTNLRYEITTTGGRMGFRGSSLNVEQSIYESITDFILDFTKRYGMTLQQLEAEESTQAKE